jgi:multidrug resistance efflux pump
MSIESDSSPAPRASRHWVKWVVILAVLLAGLAAYSLASRVPQSQKSSALAGVSTAVVENGTVERVMRLTGQTSARNFASIKMPQLRGGRGGGGGQQGGGGGVDRGGGGGANSGLTLKELVAGGAQVKKGDSLAVIDNTTYLENLDSAEDNLSQSQADLKRQEAQRQISVESLQQNLRSLKAAMDKAVQDYKASETKNSVDQELLKLQVDQTTAQYKQAQGSLALQQDSIAADMVIYEISYKKLLLSRDRIADSLKNFTFYAPMDGLTVVQTFNRAGSNQVQYQVGDSINPGQAFLKIVDPSSMQLEATASQLESRKLRIGQQARIQLDAFQGVDFPGTVYSVGAMATAGSSGSLYVRSVSVKVQIKGLDARLIPDLSGAATVTVESKPNVLKIPLAALHTEAGKDYVYVRTAQGFDRQDVQTGVRSATHAEVISGLTSGQRVALSTPPVLVAK